MKKYVLALIVTIIVFFYEIKIPTEEEIKQELTDVTPIVQTNYDIDDYVIGVISCEMPAEFNMEALKANAVAARTFALYQIKNNSSYNPYESKEQCYISPEEQKEKWGNSYNKYYKKISDAVYSTKNEIITYNDDVIKAFYFSTSNGQTENVQTVFKQDYDYLKSVSSDWDKHVNGFQKQKTLSTKEFLNLLKISDNRINNINVTKNNTNHVDNLEVNNIYFSGTEFRKILSLRSTDFDIEYNDNEVIITTRGYGHGVGMSQYGANEMAKKGYNYKDILKHYYTGVEINMYKKI